MLRFSALASLLLVLTSALPGCQSRARPAVDLLIYNATVYTVDSAFSKAEAVAMRDGRFVAVGTTADLRNQYQAKQEIDAHGQYLYPGFYDAHCHFYGYAMGLQNANLVATASWAEVVRRLSAHRAQHPERPWLTGRGWDQNDWPAKQFPTKDTLDRLFPNVPVFIERIDGHAALANQRALDLAGITAVTPVKGGVIGRDAAGKLTGLLVDNAVDLVAAKVPKLTPAETEAALLRAQANCLAVGLTSLADAGLSKSEIEQLGELQKSGKLKLRLYAMLNPTAENKAYYLPRGPVYDDHLTICSFKVYADGALGSRGACLLRPYADAPQETGFLLQPMAYYRALAKELAASQFQMNTHAIGDSTNRLLLDIYGEALAGQKDRRWRLEHAQVVAPADVAKYGRFGVIPSVQPAHATSDMPWAGTRLGPERLATAYAYERLRQQNGYVALGSDFPVEDINPLFGFHAAVARQDAQGNPVGGFQPSEALSRPDALRGMTTWAARAGFQEKRLGQIRPGLLADCVLLDTDLLQAPAQKLRGAKVVQTIIGGEVMK